MPKLELGPAGFLPASAAAMGIFQPEEGSGFHLLEGEPIEEEKVFEISAEKLLTLRNPTLFPGPMLVWGWTEETRHKAQLALDLVKEVPGMNIIPMPDYRPIYPKIDPEAVINPCHPNLTIQHNKIHVCAFIGVHCHFANITLKMIRANTNCYTQAWCAYDGHEDALLAIRDFGADKIEKIKNAIIKLKEGGLTPWAETPEGKEELEEIRVRKVEAAKDTKENAALFMHELEQGLDENAE